MRRTFADLQGSIAVGGASGTSTAGPQSVPQCCEVKACARRTRVPDTRVLDPAPTDRATGENSW
jgi:hypothetical protein